MLELRFRPGCSTPTMDDSVSIELAAVVEPGPNSNGETQSMTELTQLDSVELNIDSRSSQGETQESTENEPAEKHTKASRSVSFGRTSYSEPVIFSASPLSSFPSMSAQSSLGEDEIVLVEDVDIEMSIPDRLVTMDFPTADDGHEEDVAKVIRKSFSKMGLRHSAPDALAAISKSSLSLGHIPLMSQVEAALEAQEPRDQFWQMVAGKTQEQGIGKLEAIFEVYTDLIVEKARTLDQALLWILRQDYKEFCMELFVLRLLERGATVFTAGYDRNTPLHLAAEKGFANIGRKFIKEGALVHAKNKEGLTPIEIAIHNLHNDFSMMIIKGMEPDRVREMFQAHKDKPCRLSLHDLLEKPMMKGTMLLVLDTMMQPLPGQKDTFLVHYSVLDADAQGRAPDDPKFVKSDKSCLHKIAKSNNKDVVYHDVVRLLLRRKWKKFARYFFFMQFVYFISIMVIMTCALVLAAKKPDPRLYDEPVDIFRGICEGILIIAVIGYNGIAELHQLWIHKLHYFKDYSNYIDVPAVVFLFLIIPFRVAGLNVQWLFASMCYLFNGLRAFKYAAVFRSTGAYVQILFQILLQDMIQFGAIFMVFLISFSGAFYLALRGEVILDSPTCGNITECDNQTESIITSLDLYPFETQELYHVWLTGIRVMIEGENIIDRYFGPNGFMWLGVIIYLVFLFLVIVVLLNLLIAQMSDTYGSVQQDAQRSLVVNRAWIVARVEHNAFFGWDKRKAFYRNCEVILDPKDVLEKWEVPPINEVNRKLERIEQAVRKQEESMDDFRNVIMDKLAEQSRIIECLVART